MQKSEAYALYNKKISNNISCETEKYVAGKFPFFFMVFCLEKEKRKYAARKGQDPAVPETEHKIPIQA